MCGDIYANSYVVYFYLRGKRPKIRSAVVVFQPKRHSYLDFQSTLLLTLNPHNALIFSDLHINSLRVQDLFVFTQRFYKNNNISVCKDSNYLGMYIAHTPTLPIAPIKLLI